jgi:hypothetical protein
MRTNLDTVVISVQDTSEHAEVRQQLETLQGEHKQLVDELRTSNERLKHTNEQLQEANEELQGANEELLLAQEELQATNKEFEATNEELQATNEELEATNEELSARSAELLDTTTSLTGERVRLSQLLEVAPYAIADLRGADLLIDTTNTQADSFLGGKKAIGRSLGELARTPEMREVLDGARRAFASNSRWVSSPVKVATGDGEGPKHRVFTAVPTHDGEARVSGILLYGHELA